MMQTFVRPSRDLRNHYAEISGIIKEHNHVIITNVHNNVVLLFNCLCGYSTYIDRSAR